MRVPLLIAGAALTLLAVTGMLFSIWLLVSFPFQPGSGYRQLGGLAFGVVFYLVVTVAFGGFGIALLRSGGAKTVGRIPGVNRTKNWQLVFASSIAFVVLACFLVALVMLLSSMPVD